MKEVQITQHGDCPVKEPGDPIWFNFGSTREQARDRILAEIGMFPKKDDVNWEA